MIITGGRRAGVTVLGFKKMQMCLLCPSGQWNCWNVECLLVKDVSAAFWSSLPGPRTMSIDPQSEELDGCHAVGGKMIKDPEMGIQTGQLVGFQAGSCSCGQDYKPARHRK